MMTLLRPPTREELAQRAAALKEKLPAWVLSLELKEGFEGFPDIDILVIVKDGYQSMENYDKIRDFFYEELIGGDGWDMGYFRLNSQSGWQEAQELRAAREARTLEEEERSLP
jgi:hypothetical protein